MSEDKVIEVRRRKKGRSKKEVTKGKGRDESREEDQGKAAC